MGAAVRSPVSLLVAVSIAALGLAACGGGREPDVANGKTIFTNQCGACHQLQDAKTQGVIGPNMDDAFRGARQQGFEQSSAEGLVKQWVEQPEQTSQPVMPANIVEGDDLDDVAAYVASVAGKSPESPARPPEDIE
jgi:mono/diheme cytochrome c family protein